MRPIMVIVVHLLSHEPFQMPLIQNDHMIKQVSSASFGIYHGYALLPCMEIAAYNFHLGLRAPVKPAR